MKITCSLLFQPSGETDVNMVRADVDFRAAADLALQLSGDEGSADGTFIVQTMISEAGPRDQIVQIKFPTLQRLTNVSHLSADRAELGQMERLPQPLFTYHRVALREQERRLEQLALKAGLE